MASRRALILVALLALIGLATTGCLDGVPFVGAPPEGGCTGGAETAGCYTPAHSPASVEARVIDPYPPDPWAAPALFDDGPPVRAGGVLVGPNA